jgi:4-diphosphocytidyl-2-C-methyl-D-erythritol kinase
MSFTLLLHLWTLVSLLILGIDAFASITTSTKSTPHFSSFVLASSSSSSINNDHDNNNNKSSLTLFSPCKINLFLRILRKRPDGFHDLASLFQCIGFGDFLEMQISEQEDTFECNMPGVPVDSTNLVVRAIDVMRKKTGNESQKFKVKLTKQVPAQAGLGGGSANAATAMWGANELMSKPATLNEVR